MPRDDAVEGTTFGRFTRNSVAELWRLVELLPVGTVYVGTDGILVNPAVEEITGYTCDELGTLDAWFEALYGEDAPNVRALYERNRAGGFRERTTTVPIRRKDGVVRYVEFDARLEGDFEVWGLRDVTERVKTDEIVRLIAESSVLLASELDVETLVDELARLYVPRVADGCVIHLVLEGQHLRRLYETRMTADQRELLDAFIARSRVLRSAGPLNRVMATRTPWLMSDITPEVLELISDGDPELLGIAERLRIDSALVVPLIARGEVIGALSFFVVDAARRYAERDVALITDLVAPAAIAIQNAHVYARLRRELEERRQAEAALVASRESRLALLNNIPDPAWMKDDAGRYVVVNAAYSRATGRSMEEIVGHTTQELFDAERAARYQAQDDRALAAGGQITIEDEYIDGTGNTHLLETFTAPYHDGSGRVAGIVGIAHDVTEQRTLQAQYRQAQKMEAVGRLAGGVAHDFNNLLTVISGSADFLLADLPRKDPRREDALEIKRTALRGAALTRQLLTFSRRQVVQPRRIALTALVRDTEKMLGRLIGEDVRLETDLAEDAGVVHADAGQLEQALVNLVVNARDAMPHGGRLTLRTRRRRMDGVGSGPREFAALSVIDTGIGMDAATRDRIFEPFFTTKEPGRGTGLGLATVFGIVNQAGGQVLVETAPGRGSTFTLLLPTNGDPVDETASGSLRTAARGGAETILIVEDEPSVRRLTRRALEDLGYTVLEAGTAADAITLGTVHVGRIDLVLTDVVLPEGSGRDVADALSVAIPGVRILFMSGYAADALVHYRITELGVPFLAKPYTVEGLGVAVRAALEG
jgi:PAS domain S-box-containing protein